MKSVIAKNVKKYRKGLGMTQEALAEVVGIARSSIVNYEGGRSMPTGSTLSKLATHLKVTPDALLRDDQVSNRFRFRAHMSFDVSPQFTNWVSDLIEEYTELERCCGLNQYAPETVPCKTLAGKENLVKDVAKGFRNRLGAGDEPFNNFFREVENIGLKCLRLPVKLEGFFGLSAWSESDGAFVLINSLNTIERQLFTLAHEIGHLIFHRDEYGSVMRFGSDEQDKEQEKIADYFASHLLVSLSSFERLLPSVKSITELKKHFRVSYLVILRRLSDMELVNYDEWIRKVYESHKTKHGKLLTKEMEIPPALVSSDFPENERFRSLVLKTLESEEITESKAADLLGQSILRVREIRGQEKQAITE